MNIMVSFNDGYVMPTKVMLTSLIHNNDERIDIYVLYVELTEDSLSSIQSLSDNKRVFIYLVKVDETILEDLPIMGHFSKEAYIRLFAHSILDNRLDRILWLDGDMIVLKSLSDFYNQDFEGKVFVAVKDQICGDDLQTKKSLGMPLDVDYINSGVLLINLQLASKVIREEEIREYVKNYKEVIQYVDQDVFNGLLYNFFKTYNDEYYNYFSNKITCKNIKEIYNNAKIIHFMGLYKPWRRLYFYEGFHLWWKYAMLSDPSITKRYYIACISHVFWKCMRRLGLLMNKCLPNFYSKFKKGLNIK